MDNIGWQGGLLLWLVFAVTIVFIAFAIAMIIDAIRNKELRDTSKVLWIIGIVLFNPVVALVYYFIAHSKRH